MKQKFGPYLAGGAAGIINGLFGAGGGMILLPLLEKTTDLKEKERFACSVCIIFPLSLISAGVYLFRGGRFAAESIPYLIGGGIGGVIAGLLLRKVSAVWLHRLLGIFILWGGFRLLIQ